MCDEEICKEKDERKTEDAEDHGQLGEMFLL